MSGAIDYILGNKAVIIISIIAFLFAFVTNYIGYGGKMNLLAYVTTIAFTLSLIANAFNALKLTTQWGFWLIYNFVQLTKLVCKETSLISVNTSFISSMQSEPYLSGMMKRWNNKREIK